MRNVEKCAVPSRGAVRLAAWIKDERRTQKWIEEQTGAHQTSVSAWLAGKRPIPLEHAVTLRRMTGIAVEDWTMAAEPESGHAVKTGAKKRSTRTG